MTPDADARLLFVCTANICRSPMAQLLFRHALGGQREAAGGLDVVSAGVRASRGNRIAEHAADLLGDRGIDASDFRSRPVTPELLDGSAVVLTASREHRSAVLDVCPSVGRRLFTIREFDFLLAGADPDALPAVATLSDGLRALVRLADGQRGLRRPARAEDLDLEDPIGGRKRAFKRTLRELERALERPTRLLRAT